MGSAWHFLSPGYPYIYGDNPSKKQTPDTDLPPDSETQPIPPESRFNWPTLLKPLKPVDFGTGDLYTHRKLSYQKQKKEDPFAIGSLFNYDKEFPGGYFEAYRPDLDEWLAELDERFGITPPREKQQTPFSAQEPSQAKPENLIKTEARNLHFPSLLSRKPFVTTPDLLPPGINKPLSPEDRNNLKELQERVRGMGNEVFDLIASLPEIAEAEAETCGSEWDKKNWLKLPDMLRHWLLLKSEDLNPPPFWVNFNDYTHYKRFNAAVDAFVDPANIRWALSENGQNELYNVLEKNGYLVGEGREFNFIDAPPEQWKELYFNHKPISWFNLWPDGLMATLASFTLKALAKGRTERLPNGKYRIHVDEIGVYIHDRFNFAGNDRLGSWSKKYMNFMPYNFSTDYHFLVNPDFVKFSKATGRGADYDVLSEPHRVQKFRGFSFDSKK